jgi:hypothetical protein
MKNTFKCLSYFVSLLTVLGLVLTLSITIFALGNVINSPIKSEALETGECGATSDPDYKTSNVDATKVGYGGKTWDIIGLNTGSISKGIAGPKGTVTLLLDKESSDYTYVASTAYSRGNIYDYDQSPLQDFMTYFYSHTLTSQKGIVARTLKGGQTGKTNISDWNVTGFDIDEVRGPDVENQKLWALSLGEALQLKASVRGYAPLNTDDGNHDKYSTVSSDKNVWWLRTSDGINTTSVFTTSGQIMYYYNEPIRYHDKGAGVSYDAALARPAMYLDYSNFSGIKKQVEDNKINLGSCPKSPTIKTGDYTWDIIGYNNSSTKNLTTGKFGANTETENTATLVLSFDSYQKFNGFGSCFNMSKYNMSVFDTSCSSIKKTTRLNTYLSSILNYSMSQAYLTSKDKLKSAGISPISRTISGGSGAEGTSTYNPTKVAGDSVTEPFWALSVPEGRGMSYQSRVFGFHNSWLRTPGSDSGEYYQNAAYVDEYGEVNIQGYGVSAADSLRPAFQTKLTPELVSLINQAGGSSIYQGNADNKTPTCEKTEHRSGYSCLTNEPTSITLTNTATVTVGSKHDLSSIVKASVKSKDGSLLDTKKELTYTYSNKGYVDITTGGLTNATLLAKKAGTTYLTVKTVNGLSAKCKIVVKGLSFSSKTFKDYKKIDKKFRKSVKWLYLKGITTGTDSTHFSPKNTVSRLQMAMFMYRMKGYPNFGKETYFSFEDVPINSKTGQEELKAVNYLKDNKITTGTSETTYSSKNPVTRMQMALFLYRLAKSPKETTSNTYKVKDWNSKWPKEYKKAINYLIKKKISTQKNTFYWPSSYVTREQMAAFLDRV